MRFRCCSGYGQQAMWPGHGVNAGMLQGYMGRVSFSLAAHKYMTTTGYSDADCPNSDGVHALTMKSGGITHCSFCRAHHMRDTTGQCKGCSRWVPTGTAPRLPTATACTIPCSIRVGATEHATHPSPPPGHGIIEESATCCEGVPYFMELSAIAIHAFFHRPLFWVDFRAPKQLMPDGRAFWVISP